MNKLKYWRSVRKLEVRELAKKAGVSPTTVSRIENGRIKGQSLTLAKLAEALDVDLMEFVDLVSDPKNLPVVAEGSTGRLNSAALHAVGTTGSVDALPIVSLILT